MTHAWLIWTLLALFAWGIWAVLSKLLGAALTAEQSQALSTLGFVPILAALALSGRARIRGSTPKGLGLAFVGGIVSCLGNIPYYAAVSRGDKFATVLSLTALAPVITVLLAFIVLRERLIGPQWLGLALALVAIWIFNIPDQTGLLSPAILVALLPIILWGLSGFLQKVATCHATPEAAALIYLAAFLPMGVYYGLTQPWPADLPLRTLALVIALGFFLAFGNFAVLEAYARGGKAAVVAPLVNLFPVVSIVITVLMLGEKVGRRELAGIVCALASVAALSIERSPEAQLVSNNIDEKHI